jgi:hypothetical protein
MAFAFDTLGMRRSFVNMAIPQDQAEAHAEAAREFIMAELVTKPDLQAAIISVRQEIDALRLRLTIRMGVMLAAGLSILAAVLRLH